MKPVKLSLCTIGVLLLFLNAPAVMAWGCKGHQTVAFLAEKHLTPEAKQMFQALLTENPIDPSLKRFCGNALTDVFADAATWADDERSKAPKTAPWHFIDIPLEATQNQVKQFCGATGCVTQAIVDQLAILKDKTASPANRAEALRFLIHFVGDLHQPLHASTNSDRGGNCVPVKYLRRNPHPAGGSYTPNLHAIWDTEMVEHDMEGASPADFAETLDAEFKNSEKAWTQGGMQLDAWAWEGHQHAVSTSYGALPIKIAIEPNVQVEKCTDDNDIGDRMLHLHETAGQLYVEAAAPVIEERLAQAGFRLAMILNQAAKSNP
jgi:S1/P1 Nuclease